VKQHLHSVTEVCQDPGQISKADQGVRADGSRDFRTCDRSFLSSECCGGRRGIRESLRPRFGLRPTHRGPKQPAECDRCHR